MKAKKSLYYILMFLPLLAVMAALPFLPTMDLTGRLPAGEVSLRR